MAGWSGFAWVLALCIREESFWILDDMVGVKAFSRTRGGRVSRHLVLGVPDESSCEGDHSHAFTTSNEEAG